MPVCIEFGYKMVFGIIDLVFVPEWKYENWNKIIMAIKLAIIIYFSFF